MSKRTKKTRADFATMAEFRLWQKRSKASKKGWQTRNKRELPKKIKAERKLRENAGIQPKKKSKRKPAKDILSGPVSKLKRQLEIERRKRSQIEARLKEAIARTQKEEIDTSNWVEDFAFEVKPEFVRRDGRLAVFPSRLRLLKNADFIKIQKELYKAQKSSKQSLIKTAQNIAWQYDISVREVYTLLYSP